MYVDDALTTTWTSSGTTSDFEGIDLSGYSGQHVTITGVLADMEWLSIVEVGTSGYVACGRGRNRPPEASERHREFHREFHAVLVAFPSFSLFLSRLRGVGPHHR